MEEFLILDNSAAIISMGSTPATTFAASLDIVRNPLHTLKKLLLNNASISFLDEFLARLVLRIIELR